MDSEIAQLRLPPHSIEAEQSVLGGLLLNNGTWEDIADIITDDDFYRHDHRMIWQDISHPLRAPAGCRKKGEAASLWQDFCFVLLVRRLFIQCNPAGIRP